MFDLLENPRPWHKWLYLVPAAVANSSWIQHPNSEPLEWLGKASLVVAVSACVANDMTFSSVKWKEAWLQKRTLDPDYETKALAAAKERARQTDTNITTGNVQIAVPVASNAKKQQLHPEMVTHQFVVTAPRLDEYRTRLMLKKLCKRQLTYYKHPELGHPNGDFREQTWLKECTRRELKISLAILEFNRGIARKGSAKNSPFVITDLDIIDDGARGIALPHPSDCQCDEHSAGK
jgi:hypothetical protein